MKTSILTFSQTGNTLKVGNSIAKGLQDNGFEIEHFRFLNRQKWQPNEADVIGIGCPVFENFPAECVPEFLTTNNFDFRGKKAFVFITSGESPAKSLWHLAQVVASTGAQIIGGVQIRGAVTVPTMFGRFPNRPNKDDLKYAEDFGQAVAANFLKRKPLPGHFTITFNNGGKFYNVIGPWLTYIKKKITPLPKCHNDKCTLCGNCVYECPTNSIAIKNRVVKFNNSCIVCYRCWHVCSQNAISIKFSPGKGFTERSLYCEKMARRFGNLNKNEDFGINLYKDVLKRKIKLKYDRVNPTAEFIKLE